MMSLKNIRLIEEPDNAGVHCLGKRKLSKCYVLDEDYVSYLLIKDQLKAFFEEVIYIPGSEQSVELYNSLTPRDVLFVRIGLETLILEKIRANKRRIKTILLINKKESKSTQIHMKGKDHLIMDPYVDVELFHDVIEDLFNPTFISLI